jgi:hypothetical protein
MHESARQSHLVRSPAAVSPSLMRLSGAQRLIVAAAIAAVLWGAVVWAIS